MDREEKLRAAKEKLKKFQKKRQGGSSAPSSEILGDQSTRSTPMMDGSSTTQAQSEELSVFTFDSKSSNNQDFDFVKSDVPATNNTTFEDPQSSLTSSSVSDQIDQILSSARRISDVTNDDIGVYRLRISQVEKEKAEVDQINHQLKTQLQTLEGDLVSNRSEFERVQAELEHVKRESEQKLQEETQALKAQMDSHTDSIQILVAEKAELAANTAQLEKRLADAKSEMDRLRALGPNASSKERTCSCTERVFLAEVERRRLADNLSSLRDERDRLKIEVIDCKQEMMELRSKVDHYEKQTVALLHEVQQKTTKLELAEVNLSQLRASSTAQDKDQQQSDEGENANKELTQKNEELTAKLGEKESEVTRLAVENEEHLKRVAELTAYIQQASHDREQIIQQYTSYGQQLASQIESLTQQLNVKANENNNYASREADLVAHIERLENQLQTSMRNTNDGSSNVAPESTSEHLPPPQMNIFEKKVAELEVERNDLASSLQKANENMSSLQEKYQEQVSLVSELQTQLEMSKDIMTSKESGQHQNLLAASNSDKVAASRAMQQNQKLKKQVEELENAVVQVSNTRADLLSELEDAKRKVKKLEESDTSMNSLVTGLQESVKERDRTITRLKEQVKYYIAFAENSFRNKPNGNETSEDNKYTDLSSLINELQEAKQEIRSLHSHNSELKSQLEVIMSQSHENSSCINPTPEAERDDFRNGPQVRSSSSLSSSSASDQSNIKQEENNNGLSLGEDNCSSSSSSSGSIPLVISKDVAMLKVEEKLKNAMQKIADLTADKENLEHIIVRLQDETDTVGEYITMYQYQRAKQKEQLLEKEKQLHSVARDREELKQKLVQLQSMLTHYLHNDNQEGVDEQPKKGENSPEDTDVRENFEVAEEAETLNANRPTKQDTAGQILSLLTEIGSNEMLTCDRKTLEQFQPWFWEPTQGQLMTV